jgi:hypothetical protein
MFAFFRLEAGQPGSRIYRLEVGVFVSPAIASAVLLLLRLI